MATSSIREKLRKKYGENNEESKEEKVDTSSTRDKLRAKYGATDSEINEDYISSFFQDATVHLDNMQTKYDSMDSSNKDSVLSEQRSAYNDLSKRSNTIRQYLNRNKGRIDADSYNSLISALDEFDKASASAHYSFYDRTKWDDTQIKEYNLYRKYSGMTAKEAADAALAATKEGNKEEAKWVSEQYIPYAMQNEFAQKYEGMTSKEVAEAALKADTRAEMEWATSYAKTLQENEMWGGYKNAWDFEIVSANRDYNNATVEDLRYYDTMMDNTQWYWDANNVYRDPFGNEIVPSQDGKTWVHSMKDDEKFAVQDPVGFFFSIDISSSSCT